MIGGNLPTRKTGLPPWQWCDRSSFHVLSGGGNFSEGGLLYAGPVHFWEGFRVTKSREYGSGV